MSSSCRSTFCSLRLRELNSKYTNSIPKAKLDDGLHIKYTNTGKAKCKSLKCDTRGEYNLFLIDRSFAPVAGRAPHYPLIAVKGNSVQFKDV